MCPIVAYVVHKTKLVQLVPASEHVFGKAVKSHALNARQAAAGGLFGAVTLSGCGLLHSALCNCFALPGSATH